MMFAFAQNLLLPSHAYHIPGRISKFELDLVLGRDPCKLA
jgi:hypothetical protein